MLRWCMSVLGSCKENIRCSQYNDSINLYDLLFKFSRGETKLNHIISIQVNDDEIEYHQFDFIVANISDRNMACY